MRSQQSHISSIRSKLESLAHTMTTKPGSIEPDDLIDVEDLLDVFTSSYTPQQPHNLQQIESSIDQLGDRVHQLEQVMRVDIEGFSRRMHSLDELKDKVDIGYEKFIDVLDILKTNDND